MKTKNILTLLLLLTTLSSNAAVVYVRHNAAGSNNGTSWANAYTDLKTALTNAVSGSDIWISAGTYYLPSGSPRTSSFLITNKSLNILGNFPSTGNPTSPTQRNLSNITILSGDINQNDNGFTDTTTTSSADRQDNAYHVLAISMGAGNFTLNIYGLTIEGGNANGSSNESKGAGIYYTRNANGNNNQSHNVFFYNCKIQNNTASEAAVFYPVFGYLKCDYFNTYFQSCHINNNNSNIYPVYSLQAPSNANVALSANFAGNLIYNNIATSAGSSLMNCSGLNNQASSSNFEYRINFNTFANNKLNTGIGLITCNGPNLSSGHNQVVISNNIFNSNNGISAVYQSPSSPAFVTKNYDHNILETVDSFFLKIDGGHSKIITSGVLKNPAANDFMPADCSPVINSGSFDVYSKNKVDYITITMLASIDANGNTRTQYGTIDKGAIEYNGNKYPSEYSIISKKCFGETLVVNGKNFSETGSYTETITSGSFNGCDSIIRINLTVNDSLRARIGVQFEQTTQKFYVYCVNNNQVAFNTYEWYFNDTLVQGATTYYLERAKFGKYHAIISKNQNGITCTEKSPVYVYSNGGPSGIENTESSKFAIYPNPTQNVLYWDTPIASEVIVYNTAMRSLLRCTGEQQFVSLENLPSGIYIVYFKAIGSSYRIVKE